MLKKMQGDPKHEIAIKPKPGIVLSHLTINHIIHTN